MKLSEESFARLSSKAFFSARNERRLFRFVTVGILIALAFAVALLRLHRLDELPPGLYSDEGQHGLNALRIMQGEHSPFFPEKAFGVEALMPYVVVPAISLLGRTELALRLPAALASAGTILVVLWLGQLMFGRDEKTGQATPWRGLFIGGIAAGLLAVSVGSTIIGRTAFRHNFFALVLCLCLALTWAAWHRPGAGAAWWRVAAAGACTGLLSYTYTAARFVPILFLLFALSFLLPLGPRMNSRLRAQLPRVVVFVGVAGLVAAPLLVYFALHPEDFLIRSNQVWIFLPEISQGDPLGVLLTSVWEHMLIFGYRGDPYWQYNIPFKPMLNLWQAVFFWLGLGMAVWRW